MDLAFAGEEPAVGPELVVNRSRRMAGDVEAAGRQIDHRSRWRVSGEQVVDECGGTDAHVNASGSEGHAGLAVMERVRDFMTECAKRFRVALTVIRAGNVFSTHAAVAAGFDRFAPAVGEHFLGEHA